MQLQGRHSKPEVVKSALRALLLALITIQIQVNLISGLIEATRATASSTAASLRAATANASTSTTSGSKPLWHRPGCYQVGHTRTISIPGCVKFNLSTNACRGFCMSFSIPAAEDIGPAEGSSSSFDETTIIEQSNPGGGGGGVLSLNSNSLGDSLSSSDRMLKRTNNGNSLRRRSSSGGPLATMLERDSNQLAAAAAANGGRSQTGSGASTLPAGEKRDVISVGQCCNMMETEDVTVNLRCGFNETRKLVFKSAKTCECFFCKHV